MSDIEYRFGTGTGDPQVHHSAANVDVSGDGTADGVALDFDGDGRVDDVMWDSDGDGVADTAMLDLDDDGKAESAYHDPAGQGTWNARGEGAGHAGTAGGHPPTPPTGTPEPGPHPSGEEESPYAPYDDPDDSGGLFDDLVTDADPAAAGDDGAPDEWLDLDR